MLFNRPRNTASSLSAKRRAIDLPLNSAVLAALVGVVCLSVVPASGAQARRQHVVAPADLVLTSEVLSQFNTFWTAFAQEADSIRMPSLEEMLGTPAAAIAIDTVYSGGRIDRTEWVQNMTVLSARYPSVAADLASAGLTSRRYTTFFGALLNACRTFNGMSWGNPVTPTPGEAKNIALLTAHWHEFEAMIMTAGTEEPWYFKTLIVGTGDCDHMRQFHNAHPP